MKKRLDALLVERGLAETRTQAQALILAGRVPGYDKPGTQVDEQAELAVSAPPRYVSRGGEKLAHALDEFGADPARRDCVDVGYGQLHERLRADPRVIVLERTNARELSELPFAPEFVVCDVSFISIRLVVPPVLALSKPGWEALVLIKPQFEAGRAEVKGGVVRDVGVRRRVVREIAEAALAWEAQTLGAVDSGLPGPKGNREVFLHLVHRERPQLPDDIDDRIAAAVS